MNILVAVASKHGSTREIGDALAAELRAHGLTVEVRDAGEVGDVTGYDAVILGSAVYTGNWLPDAQQFIEVYGPELAQNGIPTWLFSSGPLGTGDLQPHNDPAILVSPMGNIPVKEHRMFAGKLDEAELGLGERLMVKIVRAPAGDFRDWDEIRDWAKGIAAELALPSLPSTT